jgi:esterase/lipase
MKRSIKIVLGVAVGILVLGMVGILWKTRQEAYNLLHALMATRELPDEIPSDYNLEYEDVTVTNPEGMKLAGWFIPSENGAVIIMQHGYKSTRSEMLNEAEMMHRHGYGVLLTTVRAHDESEGELITLGYYEMADLEAWYQYLISRDEIDPEKIGILGNSYGGMLSIQYAMNDTVATSVEHFTGLPEFPFVPLIVFWAENMTGISIDDINTTQWIPGISPRPVFLMQGGKDTTISPQSGQILYDAAGEPKELWFDPELGHVDFDTERAEEFEARVSAFFDQDLLGQ